MIVLLVKQLGFVSGWYQARRPMTLIQREKRGQLTDCYNRTKQIPMNWIAPDILAEFSAIQFSTQRLYCPTLLIFLYFN